MRILVVDDEVTQLIGLKIGLRTEGHIVATAESGEEALEGIKAESSPFDLIITDYLMAGMNGIDLLKEVRKMVPFVPVILMTAHGTKKVLIEAMQNECSGCIEKPFSLEQLVDEIARVTEHTRYSKNFGVSNMSLAHIVHQIKNPLAAIIGSAKQTLRKQPDPEATKKRMETIILATNKIAEINKTILDLGKPKEKKGAREKVDLKWLLNDCLDMFTDLLAKRGVTLVVEITNDQLQVIGDRFGLEQIFTNLLMNAIEAMDETAHKLLSVTIETDENNWVAVHIADTGCGVPDVSIKEFFNTAKTTKKYGFGIGLQVVKEMVGNHNDELQMSSREGEGTVITILLPNIDSESPPGVNDVFTQKPV